MRRLLVAAIAVSSLALAQQPPAAADLFARYAKALGSLESQRAVTTRLINGTVENSDDGSTSKIEIAARAPNLYSVTVTSPDNDVTRRVYAGNAGWFSDPDSGVRAMSSAELAQFAAEYDFYRPLHLAELYPVAAAPRQAALAARPVWIVDVKTASGAPEKLSFDAATGLLVCREYERLSLEDGITNFQEFYDDYRAVEGVQTPFQVRRATPDYQLTYRFTSVRLNAPIHDSLFAQPAK